MSHSSRLLLTGGTGFLGKAVLRQALASDCQVAVLTRSSKPTSLSPGVQAIGGGLAAPDWNALEVFRPTICIHCAWVATPGEYVHSPLNAQLAESTVNLARRLETLGLRHFVGIGSCAEYEPSARPLKEGDPETIDQTPYVKAKLKVLHFLESSFGAPFAWLRIFYLYGPGEHPGRFLTSAAKTLKAGRKLFIQRPENLVDYVHVDDAADAIWQVVQNGLHGIINIGSGEARKVSEIAGILGALTDRQEQVHCADQKTSTSRVANIEKLQTTGWKPRRDFGRSLEEIVETA